MFNFSQFQNLIEIMCGVYFIILFLIPFTLSEFKEGDLCSLKNSALKGTCMLHFKCFHYEQKRLLEKENSTNCGNSDSLECCPLSGGITSIKDKSRAACHLYETWMFLTVTFGEKVDPYEFPHMAAIGYENENSIHWLCGGSLISNFFVLTAAHCLQSRQYGEAKWVRLGHLDLSSTVNEASQRDYRVLERISHPQYHRFLKYHDIGLLRIRGLSAFYKSIKPICLHTKSELPSNSGIVAGWGTTKFGGKTSPNLLKANLQYVSHKECQKNYGKNKHLPQGILEESQLCAANTNGSDTCQGDSGGPIQTLIKGKYFLTGITSFGQACGIGGFPAVYTRISYYIPWIEENVWPN